MTEWILDKLITVPYENLETPAALAYFVVASPAIGVGAISGYAIDEVNTWIVTPVDATLGKLADIVGAGDSPQELLEKIEQNRASKAEAEAEPSSPSASDSAASGDQGDDAACYPVAGDGSRQPDHDAAQDEAAREPSPPASDSAATGGQGEDVACYPVAGDGLEQPDPDAAQDEAYPISEPEEAPTGEGDPDGE